jgi:hypothetical protein
MITHKALETLVPASATRVGMPSRPVRPSIALATTGNVVFDVLTY